MTSGHSKVVDFGLATRLEEDDDWGVWPIQPDHYRAPEVILGNGWQMPADIWNLVLVRFRCSPELLRPLIPDQLWDMIEGKSYFGIFMIKKVATMLNYTSPK